MDDLPTATEDGSTGKNVKSFVHNVSFSTLDTTSKGDEDSTGETNDFIDNFFHCFHTGIANGDISLKPVSMSTTDPVIVQDLSASWSMDSSKLTLRNISFTVNKVY